MATDTSATEALLRLYGLQSLIPWAKQKMQEGASQAQVELEMQDQPAFKQRFWVIDKMRAQGRPVPTPQDIFNYEEQWRSIAVAGGLPVAYQARDNAQRFMEQGVAVTEAQQRVQDGYVKVLANPVIADTFQNYYGVSRGGLAAFFIDGDNALPHLEQQVTAATIGAQGQARGFGLDVGRAEQLAQFGVTGDQAHQGFDQLDQMRHLFDETISEKANLTAQQEGVGAVFGMDATSADVLAQRANERKAAFAGSSDATSSREGITGLGTARNH